ncbi:hypothetical protein [Aeoliella sp. SH292]|uniref:hypothetical protein n=1 Tax=Aeoliella sp. SH292 TaxID=3454464 RepID=UPI003F99A1C3
MKTGTNDLSVTILSSDRELLCDLSWTLGLFGYQVTPTCDFSDESPCRRNLKPGILLVDARPDGVGADVLPLPATSDYVYQMAIAPPEAAEKLMLAGADDVVRYPVNIGELLTRLRAGVRRLEFESRMSRRQRRDPETGLLTRETLLTKLTSSNMTPSATTWVALGIDCFAEISQQYGLSAVRTLKATLARQIAHALHEGECAGVLGDNALFIALARDTAAAHQFADAIASRFSSNDTLVRTLRSLPTLTAVHGDWDVTIAPAEQLDRCASALEQSFSYGGNHIASASEVQQRVAQWRSDLDTGVPFEEVIAQDLMEFFPAILTREQLDAGFDRALPAAGLQLPCLPVVDDEGRLTGSLTFTDGPRRGARGALMPHIVEYHQPLSELFEAFNATESDYLVVVDGRQRPIGYLTCESLASLVLDQMSAERYRAGEQSEFTTASLVVPVGPCVAEPVGV